MHIFNAHWPGPSWNGVLLSLLPGDTVSGQGAAFAVWPARCADQRPEFHHRLVESAHLFAWQHLLGPQPKLFLHLRAARVAIDPKEPAQDTPAVRFEDRQALIEGLRQDGIHGIAAESWQLRKNGRIIGNRAAMIFKNDLR